MHMEVAVVRAVMAEVVAGEAVDTVVVIMEVARVMAAAAMVEEAATAKADTAVVVVATDNAHRILALERPSECKSPATTLAKSSVSSVISYF